MKIHVHDNNKVLGPKTLDQDTKLVIKDNCLGQFQIYASDVLSLHMHEGDCDPCPRHQCHKQTINIVVNITGDVVFVVFEGIKAPGKITVDSRFKQVMQDIRDIEGESPNEEKEKIHRP